MGRAHKRRFTEPMPDNIERSLERVGATRLHGTARFGSPDTATVDGRELRGRHFLVATGAKPRRLDFPGAEHVIDSTAFLELDALPRRVVFVGGGYVSMEFAHITCRAGVHTTVIEHGDRILKPFDPDLTHRLTDRSRQSGIDIRLGTEIDAVWRTADGLRVRSTTGAIDCDLVVHGAGRVADIEELHLDRAGIEATRDGVGVNEFLQSPTNGAVSAAGDAADIDGLRCRAWTWVFSSTHSTTAWSGGLR